MQKNAFSKWIVAMVILLNICFTAAVLYLFRQTGSEPTVLIGCWFAFTTGELWMLASIRKAKVRTGGERGEYRLEEEVDE